MKNAIVKKENTIPALSVGKFTVTPTGLVLNGQPRWEEWEVFLGGMQKVHAAVNWVIGDALQAIENQYGENGSQMLAAFPEHEYNALRQYQWVSDRVQFVLRNTNLSWSHHYQVAALSPAQQKKWLKKAEKKGWSVAKLRSEIQLHKPTETPPIPKGKYNIIYADPPWRYDFSPTSGRKVERHYPTMELEDICKKTKEIVDKVAYKDCTLFLWGTSPKLTWAFSVIDFIEFEYKTCMVWVKDKIGMGYYARQQHEMLLIAGRGKSQLPAPHDRPSSIIQAPRLEHSAKPTLVYEIIERMYPSGRPIELFARGKRKGWTSWGNEI